MVEQPEQLGTAHAVLHCSTYLQGQADTVLVLYGDTPLVQPATLRRMLEHHRTTGATVTILTFVPSTPQGYGRNPARPRWTSARHCGGQGGN